MNYYRTLFNLLLFVLFSFLAQTASAETWRLDQGGQLKPVSESPQDEYLLAVAQVKKLVSEGKAGEVADALKKLKSDFPDVAGPDLDLFIKAEIFYAAGKFTKAVRTYDKILTDFPESKLYDAVLDRQYAVATAYLAGQKKSVLGIIKINGYAEGTKIMENIADRTGNAPIAVDSAVSVAKNYEKRGKFEDAYFKWSEISNKWPGGEIGKQALLGMARCKLSSYKGPAFSASDLVSAKTYYENFSERYPKDAEKLDISGTLANIREQLAYKQLTIGQYYQRTEGTQAANYYYQMVLDTWPESKSAIIAKDLLTGKDIQGKKVK